MRYVLLRHECPPDYRVGSHWDLMLERDGVLLTWSLQQLPAQWGGDAGERIEAERLADHRLAYLDYEGPVSGNRGAVTRVAGGEFTWVSCDEQRIEVELTSGAIAGRVEATNCDDGWELQASPR